MELVCKRLEYANEKNENLEIRRRESEQIADQMKDASIRAQEELQNFKRYAVCVRAALGKTTMKQGRIHDSIRRVRVGRGSDAVKIAFRQKF